MVKKSAEPVLNLVCNDIQRTGCFTEKQKRILTNFFGKRFTTAYKALNEGKIKKYVFYPSKRSIWIVKGRKQNYQILPLANFCSCFDFYFRVISQKTSFCYHLIAQKLAEALERYVVIEESDTRFIQLIENWRKTINRKRALSRAEVENARKAVTEILLKEKELPIQKLLNEVINAGFSNMTTRHLANILKADKAKRFKQICGLWTLNVNVK